MASDFLSVFAISLNLEVERCCSSLSVVSVHQRASIGCVVLSIHFGRICHQERKHPRRTSQGRCRNFILYRDRGRPSLTVMGRESPNARGRTMDGREFRLLVWHLGVAVVAVD